MIEEARKALLAHNARTTFENRDMPAAVLLPLVEYEGRTQVLFEVRGHTLRRQPGEISFPGGRYEEDDPSPWEAAKRETCEELGITANQVEYLGTLDYYAAPIGVKVYPFVGKLHTLNFSLSETEVDDVFFVPLQDLLDMEPRTAVMQVATSPLENFPFEMLPNYEKGWKFRKNYEVYFYPYENRVIWGLTASILKNFLDIYRKIM